MPTRTIATPMSLRTRLALLVALIAAAGVMTAAPAQAATPRAVPSTASSVAGTYTLHYEWYSAPGYWQTSGLTLNADGTCSLSPSCSWALSGASSTSFTMTIPNPRRGGIIYRGTVTATGLSSSTGYGHQYFGNPYYNNAPEGDWYAQKG
jgi:hypothetical protein